MSVHPNALAAKWEKSDRRRIHEYVAEEPGSTSTDVSRDLGLPLQTASSHLAAMWRSGRMTRERVGRVFAYRVPGAETGGGS